MLTAVDVISILVWDLNAEFLLARIRVVSLIVMTLCVLHCTNLFDGNDNLDGVQAIQAEIVGEMRVFTELLCRGGKEGSVSHLYL